MLFFQTCSSCSILGAPFPCPALPWGEGGMTMGTNWRGSTILSELGPASPTAAVRERVYPVRGLAGVDQWGPLLLNLALAKTSSAVTLSFQPHQRPPHLYHPIPARLNIRADKCIYSFTNLLFSSQATQIINILTADAAMSTHLDIRKDGESNVTKQRQTT